MKRKKCGGREVFPRRRKYARKLKSIEQKNKDITAQNKYFGNALHQPCFVRGTSNFGGSSHCDLLPLLSFAPFYYFVTFPFFHSAVSPRGKLRKQDTKLLRTTRNILRFRQSERFRLQRIFMFNLFLVRSAHILVPNLLYLGFLVLHLLRLVA